MILYATARLDLISTGLITCRSRREMYCVCVCIYIYIYISLQGGVDPCNVYSLSVMPFQLGISKFGTYLHSLNKLVFAGLKEYLEILHQCKHVSVGLLRWYDYSFLLLHHMLVALPHSNHLIQKNLFLSRAYL